MISKMIYFQNQTNKLIIFSLLLFVSSCSSEKNNEKILTKAIEGMDLPQIIKRGKLIVLAENSSTSYFIYRGKKMGFEYEILREFAKEIGVELEIITISDLNLVNQMLNEGIGDIISCNYTVTNDRKKEIDFSSPILRTPQVLVQRKPDDWKKMSSKEIKKQLITDPTKLARKKIHVWNNSSYYQRLINLQNEIGDTIYIQEETGNISAEDLIEKVSDGILDYTVVEKNIAQINARFFDNIDIDLELSFNQKIAFGLRKTSPLLRSRLNNWLSKFTQKSNFKYIKRKYFKMTEFSSMSKSDFSSIKGGQISNYDEIIKRESVKWNWDWRLIAALIYQESKFNPNVVGFGGSYGMMQFMPEVGPKFGVYPHSTPEIQIKGGLKKLNADYKNWPEITDKEQRQKFALASYNAGLGHIKDAQRLAQKHNLNPLMWDDNVEVMLKNLSLPEYYRDEVVKNGSMRGGHTYKYVRSIISRYESYKSVFE
jgi:membrane-bound lytic murein transglycosylase F